MSGNRKREVQQRHEAKKREQGLERLVLWVRPEDKPAFKLAAGQPHALKKLERDAEKRLLPEIEARVRARLSRKTQRAFVAQRRKQATQHPASSNRPPECIRFKARPPGSIRNRLKGAGWLYDPVAAVWHLPDDPEVWPATERLLDELDSYDIERLVEPLD